MLRIRLNCCTIHLSLHLCYHAMLARHVCMMLSNAELGCRAGVPTLNTASWLTSPLPEAVACRLFSACRMSPSAVNTTASRPSSIVATCAVPCTSKQGPGFDVAQ